MTRSGNELRYAQLRRNDDTNLVYIVESCTNLLSGVWTDAGYTVTGTNLIGGAYDEVAYRITADAPETHIRLKLLYP